MNKIEKMNILKNNGWHMINYNTNYWVHPVLVDNKTHDYRHFGMTLNEAIDYNKNLRPLTKKEIEDKIWKNFFTGIIPKEITKY